MTPIVDQITKFLSRPRRPRLAVIREGMAMRVVFFYPGDEGAYLENVHVTLYENGIVVIRSKSEETTTHLQNCEILWSFEDNESRTHQLHVVKPRTDRKDKGPEEHHQENLPSQNEDKL